MNKILQYLRFHGPDVDGDIDEELQFHLAMREQDYRARGLTPTAARRAAEKRFGDVIQVRDVLRTHDERREQLRQRRETMSELAQDLRFAFRALRRAPSFALVSALTLALGIGANTAVFSVINGVVLSPLPFREPDRLVLLWETLPSLPQVMLSYPDYLDWTVRARVFDGLALYSPFRSFALTGSGEPEKVGVGLASGNLFDLLGVAPQLGRGFHAADDRAGAPDVILLSDGFWRRRFAADPGVVGRPLVLDGVSYRVIGVLPPEARLGGPRIDGWVTVGAFAGRSNEFSRANHPGLIGVGRLKPGVTLAQMVDDLSRVARELEREHPKENAGIGAGGMYLKEQSVRSVRPALSMLAGAVAFVLLIACANVANLSLGRAASRRKEVALRLALGAGRRRIVRQLLTESVSLALIGGALGVALAYGGVRLLLALQPSSIPRLTEVRIDVRVLAFALVVSVATGILFGLVPALQAARADLHDSLKEGGRGGSAATASLRLRGMLMLVEVALALVLLVGAGLLMRSVARLTDVDAGVDPRGVVVARLDLPPSKYPDSTRLRNAFDEILQRVRAIPGVTGAAIASDPPLNGGWQTKITFEGHPRPKGTEVMLNGFLVSPEYFDVLRVRLASGRVLDAADTPDRPCVAMINESAARRFLPGENPVGRWLRHGPFDSTEEPCTVVGVLRDVKNESLGATTNGAVYYAFSRMPENGAWIIARSELPLAQLVPRLRREVAGFDADLPLSGVATVMSLIAGSTAQPRFSSLMLAIFAGVALALAAVGIYGIISYLVAQRAREIGIRMALGALRVDVVTLVVRQVLIIAAAGVVTGILISLIASRLMKALLFGVTAWDPVSYAGAATLLLGVAVIAAALPALRASKLEPVRVLRDS